MNTSPDSPALPLLEALLRQEWRVLDTPLPWISLLEVADEQRVAPLLCHQLRAAGQWSCLPQPWAEQLLTRYQESALRNALYLNALEALVALLNRVGIEPILLKGAALAYAVYPHPALRPMGDLDLWVPSRDFDTAAHALVQAGWQPTVPGQWSLIQAEISHHLGLVNPSGFPRSVELHRRWMTLPPALRPPDTETLVWEHAQPMTIGRAQARILAPLDHFIYLVAHLARHAAHQDRLLWYTDLVVLVEHDGSAFEWDRLVERAEQLGLAVPLAWVVDALSQRLGLDVPGTVHDRVGNIQPDLMAAALFAPPSADWQEVRVERAWRMWWGLTDWKARLLWARELILPRPSLLARLYPQDGKTLRLLRYPQRWIDYGFKLLRLARSALASLF